MLSSYEPTHWHLEWALGVTIDAIHLVGYHAQTIDPGLGIPVTTATVDQGSGAGACGYSYPYNGEGCNTNELIAYAEALAGQPFTSFHGCYHAQEFTLHAGGEATSNCATSMGYEQDDAIGTCEPPAPTSTWTASDFTTIGTTACAGARYVRFDETYGLYIGAVLCGGADQYKLYASADPAAPFLELADYAGHGQDHCELVNPVFAIPNEDDITSGGCTDCAVDGVIDLIGVPVYARATFGEPFERVTSQNWADLTTAWYRCGVAIP